MMRFGLSSVLATCVVTAAFSAHAAAPAPPSPAPPPAVAADPFAPLEFLIGDWRAEGGGTPGQGVGSFSFTRSLQDRVILRTSSAHYPGTPGKPEVHHDDLMVIYLGESGEVRADYYDSEGHVIRYTVTATSGKEAVFMGESMGGTSRFRLTYTLDDAGSLSGRFAWGFPDQQPEIYSEYLSWTAQRVAAGTAAASATAQTPASAHPAKVGTAAAKGTAAKTGTAKKAAAPAATPTPKGTKGQE